MSVVAAIGMLAIAAHSDVLKPVSETVHRHPAHFTASSPGGEFAGAVDQSHSDRGASTMHHGAFPTVMVTKSSLTAELVALVLVAALVVAVTLAMPLSATAARGPPWRLSGARTGQDLLSRFCLSRR